MPTLSAFTVTVAGSALAGLIATSAPLVAHHAFGAEFDANRPVTLKGVITRMEWVNPHSWIHIDVNAYQLSGPQTCADCARQSRTFGRDGLDSVGPR